MSQGTRRLAAIMFTDMVGYTTLSQNNEALAMELLEEHRVNLRPMFQKHNGREVKTIGDAFLVEFASALEAVRCAFDIQQSLRELNSGRSAEKKLLLRIGIHLGDVIHNQNDVYGDAVNLSSRIEPLASPGGICVTGQVYDQIKSKFEFPLASLGKRELKNVNEIIEVFQVILPWERNIAAETVLDKHRVAVLPFASLSPDPNDEFFADGLTEELTDRLCHVEELEVIARTSAISYKKKDKRAAEIGTELRVGSLVEGSVRKAGNKIRVTAQLIDTTTEGHLWSSSYDRNLEDIFEVQSDVAKQVAEALQINLLPDDRRRLEKSPTSNIEAYTLYLKGQFYSNRGTEDGFRKAIACYEQALVNDPDFAFAYAELGSCFTFQGFFGMLPSKEAGAKARTCVKRALELDDSLAEAHVVMGNLLRVHDWDFAAAGREYKRAMELNPSLAEAYTANARLMMFNRRFDEAVAEVSRALELDPLSGETSQPAGVVFLYSGHYDNAIEQFTKALKIDPDISFARGNLGLAYIQKGMIDVGIKEVKRVATIKNPATQSDLAYALAKAGEYQDLKKLLNVLVGEVGRNNELAVAVASAYANLGDWDNASEWLERAYSERVAYLVSANSDFVFDNIRSDLRFQTLMKKIGFTNTR